MSSRGSTETAQLRENVENQLNRLLTQLKDIEEMKEELEEEEYLLSKKETLDQLKEFEVSLQKMSNGNMTLVDQLSSVQIAIQAAIRESFRSPEVIKMFAKKENGALRSKLQELNSNLKLGKITAESYNLLVFDILTALKKLGECLSPEEDAILDKNYNNIEKKINEDGDIDGAKIVSKAHNKISSLNK